MQPILERVTGIFSSVNPLLCRKISRVFLLWMNYLSISRISVKLGNYLPSWCPSHHPLFLRTLLFVSLSLSSELNLTVRVDHIDPVSHKRRRSWWKALSVTETETGSGDFLFPMSPGPRRFWRFPKYRDDHTRHATIISLWLDFANYICAHYL